jgi:hypothetical protein
MGAMDPVVAWLSARLYKTDFRPVTLQEHVVFDTAVFSVIEPRSLPVDAVVSTPAAAQPAQQHAQQTGQQRVQLVPSATEQKPKAASAPVAGGAHAAKQAGFVRAQAALAEQRAAVMDAAAANPRLELLKDLCDQPIGTPGGKPAGTVPSGVRTPQIAAQNEPPQTALMRLALGGVRSGHGTLVFCTTRKMCEVQANVMCQLLAQERAVLMKARSDGVEPCLKPHELPIESTGGLQHLTEGGVQLGDEGCGWTRECGPVGFLCCWICRRVRVVECRLRWNRSCWAAGGLPITTQVCSSRGLYVMDLHGASCTECGYNFRRNVEDEIV